MLTPSCFVGCRSFRDGVDQVVELVGWQFGQYVVSVRRQHEVVVLVHDVRKFRYSRFG